MNESITLVPAGPEDVPGIVELCLSVERQHEAYWPLRWQLRSDLRQRYHRWLESNLTTARWLILCAKAGASAGPVPPGPVAPGPEARPSPPETARIASSQDVGTKISFEIA